MAYTAAIFPEHQTLKQKSLIWKMAASCSQPLHTKSIHHVPMGSIQMVEESPEGGCQHPGYTPMVLST